MSKPSSRRRRLSQLAGVTLFAASCGHPSAATLTHAQQVVAQCPPDGSKVAAFIASDQSESRRGTTAQSPQQEVIEQVAERTLICGGHLRTVVFAGSMIDVTVFDSDLTLDGGTQNARLRKVPDAVTGVMAMLNAALPAAESGLTDGATDIVGQYQPAAEYETQLAKTGRFRLELAILTDGIQTAGADLEDPSLTEQQAVDMADGFAVPDLSGATVRLVGIGRQANGAPLPTPYVAALRAFHSAICTRARATCTVVTDAAGS